MASRTSVYTIEPKTSNEIVRHTTIKSSCLPCDTGHDTIHNSQNVKDNLSTTSNISNLNSATVPIKIDPQKIRSTLLANPFKSSDNKLILFKWRKQIDEYFQKIRNRLKLPSKTSSKYPVPRKTTNTIKTMKNVERPRFINMKPYQVSKRRVPLSLRFAVFFVKISIVTATICGTTQLGVWGSVEDSNRAASTIYKILTGEKKSKSFDYGRITNDLKDSYNKAIEWSFVQIREFPEKTSKFYYHAFNYIQSKIKSQ